jgi:hypothetical protein
MQGIVVLPLRQLASVGCERIGKQHVRVILRL